MSIPLRVAELLPWVIVSSVQISRTNHYTSLFKLLMHVSCTILSR